MVLKKINIALIAAISLFLVGCNKDEEIMIQPPMDNPEAPTIVLDFSVLEYTPAPGQYINDSANGSYLISNAKEACTYAEQRFKTGSYVSLGSWGGYIIIKFDQPIKNSGGYDFAISSNAFDTSNEPGIVWVMQDKNGNKKPDDQWYELKGSYFGQEGYERNYWVTYFRPTPKGNTTWENSNGETGEIQWQGSYHEQDYYYPQWIKQDSFTYYGSKLPSQAIRDDLTGTWSNLPFDWGYADNFGKDFISSYHQNLFRISEAIGDLNEEANLESIDFVKVQTGINGSSGWLGEISTEVCGFFRLD